MKLRHESSRRNRSNDKKPKRKSRFKQLAAATAAAAMLYLCPSVGSVAHAQESQPSESSGERSSDRPAEERSAEGDDVPAEESFGAMPVEAGTVPAATRPAARPATRPAAERPAFAPSEGEEATRVAEPESEERTGPESQPAEEPVMPQQMQRVFFTNMSLEPFSRLRSDYEDPALSSTPNRVGISGRRRRITLDNSWDLGGNVYGNEAGTAVFGTVRFRDLLRFDGGNIWFGERPAPYGRLLVRPELNLWRFRLAYYGTATGMGNMPSYFYTSHSASLGLSLPIQLDSEEESRRLWIRTGVVAGGALSLPRFDDIYYNIVTGLSLQLSGYPDSRFDYMLYGMATFFAAASDPMKTAYIGYYEPRFQVAEIGAQVRMFDDYTVRLFGNVGGLQDRIGLRGTWTVEFSDSMEADFWLGIGATHWSEHLGGRWDVPTVMIGATIVIGGPAVNSTNTSRFEHLQSGGVRFAETDFPTEDAPGPYGFGRSGNPDFDVPVNEAKRRIMQADSFEDFVSSYEGASEDEVILAARFLGAFLQQVAYSHDAQEALYSTEFFDPSIIRVASATNQTMYTYLREYVEWYEHHPPGEEMPEHLRSGIGMCSGIHWMVASFLQSHGVPTLVASVNTPNGPHMVAISQLSDRTILFDYGNTYETEAQTFDESIRFYGWNRGAPTFQSQIFSPDGEYLGTYITSEGRLLHGTIGLDNEEILRRDVLGIR
jgi:hypothetical protein